jgi:galactokinase
VGTGTSGTSGFIIDNTSSSKGASQIYYSTLVNESCGGNGSTGSGTGGCAVQTAQSGL